MMENNSNKYYKLFTDMIIYTTKVGASDLHIVVDSKPAIRLQGKIVRIEDMDVVSEYDAECIVEYIKKDLLELEHSTIYEYDGSFSIKDLGRFRINIYRTKSKYALAIRVLPIQSRELSDLGLPEVVKRFTYKKNGLVLITGPTGSGKSTTLAALLDIINFERNCHIITIEDPIEYIYDHKNSIITQREIGVDSLSFADALRAAMREDPDVILVGEMRDPETIQVALTAAETGHLVFSTLHTIGAAKTIDRIVDSFESGKQNQIVSQLATVLVGVVSQVLLPQTDNSGRVLACEVMFNNPAIRNLIRERKPHQITNVMQSGRTNDMITLDNELIRLFRSHTISQESALSIAQNSEYVKNAISRERR